MPFPHLERPTLGSTCSFADSTWTGGHEPIGCSLTPIALGGTSARAHNSAVECVLHTDEVAGSNPAAPTEPHGFDTTSEHAEAPLTASRPRVLVAEDDEDVRAAFETVLGERFETRCVGTATQPVAMAAAWSPDVILLDWILPDGFGEDVVRQLRASEREVPIVVVSGAPNLKELAAGVGAVPCPKPCDIEQRTSAVEAALARAKR